MSFYVHVHVHAVIIYAVELLGESGVKPITTAFVQIDVGSCQQPVGWFDQLDPQWNVTQCVLDKVRRVCCICQSPSLSYYYNNYSCSKSFFKWLPTLSKRLQ